MIKLFDRAGLVFFLVAMSIAAGGMYFSAQRDEAVVLLLATGVSLGAYLLSIMKGVYENIARIDQRQSAWETDRRAHDRAQAARSELHYRRTENDEWQPGDLSIVTQTQAQDKVRHEAAKESS